MLLYFASDPLRKYLALILNVALSRQEHAIYRTFTPYYKPSRRV